MTKLIADKKEIDRIIFENIKNHKMFFTKYYFMRPADRGLNHDYVKEILPEPYTMRDMFHKLLSLQIILLEINKMGNYHQNKEIACPWLL